MSPDLDIIQCNLDITLLLLECTDHTSLMYINLATTTLLALLHQPYTELVQNRLTSK